MVLSSHLDAVLSLLDDPDPIVISSVRNRLLEIGPETAPALRRLAEAGEPDIVRSNAQEILTEIGLRRFTDEMERVIGSQPAGEDIDLEHGAFTVALLRYPDLDIGGYGERLDEMAFTLEWRLRRCPNALIAVREMNRFLVNDLGFRGAPQENYGDPDNSFLNRVVDRRVGIPISLSVLYLLLAGRLRMPLRGIGFPRHFLVKYHAPGEEFFIDPYNGGMILSYEDCRRYLRIVGVDYNPSFLDPVNNRQIVARMLRNLAEIYRDTHAELTGQLEGAIEQLLGKKEEEEGPEEEE
jgi:regulator of sirC expression with transglutaminase-like and TPR domain